LKWVFDEDEVFVDFHTSYLGQEFYGKLLDYKSQKQEKAVSNKVVKSKDGKVV